MRAWQFLVVLALLPAGLAAAQVPARSASAGKAAPLPWLARLTEARLQAQRRRQPILVLFRDGTSASWASQDEAIRKRDVQRELANWTLVALDLGESADDARRLAVTATPAFCVLTAGGRLVASREGFLSAEQLLAWLRHYREEAALRPGRELMEADVPDAETAAHLVGDLRSREPAIREAAVRRLLPYPGAGTRPVVAALGQDSLQGRLAALELLRGWKAPVAGLDPWRPETITKARLKTLEEWAARAGERTGPTAESPGTDDLAAARREIRRMLTADDTEAAAIREHLACYGPGLLPNVTRLLGEATSDRARERLTALRYRLVARDSLVLSWPGGLERLAATDAASRRQAVRELIGRATPADEPLLVELFSSPDPLVRELCLHALRGLADPKALAALVHLLADPEPNVRAAVLKQLAEHPLSDMVPAVANYVAGEKDPDLVIHAVRFLKADRSPAAVRCLETLLGHVNWSVRAEAAEALGEALRRGGLSTGVVPENILTITGSGQDASGRRGGLSAGGLPGNTSGKLQVFGGGSPPGCLPAELRDEACAALIVCLKDSDGFVVSKAASALAAANTPAAVEPLVQAARDHPELASLILGTLASSGTMRLPAVPHLRKLCTHPNPVLRAAALTALCRAVPDEVEAELRAGLQDQADPVRRAAAVGLFSILQSLGRRPSVGQVGTAGSATWQQEVRAGTRGPAWLRTLPPLLQPLLKARDPGERLAAALALTALGHEDVAFPALVEAAQTQPALWARVADGLAWLPLPRRLELFNRLAALSKNPDQLTVAIYGLIRVRNPAEAAPLWRLCAAKKVAPDVARAILAALEEIACGQRLTTRERIRALTPAAREQVVAACRPRAEAGPATQRRIALALLLAVSPDAAAAAARKVAEDGKAEPLLRQNALQVLLLSRPRAEGQRLALGYLEHADPWLRRGAVGYLAVGPAALAFIGPEDIPLVVDNPSLSEPSGQLDRSVVTQVPPGLRPEVLLPLARDRDAWTSTSAGYLLVLMGRREGIEPLVRYWKSWRRHNDWLLRLVYRGIPALDDDSNVSVLEQIYRSFGPEDSRVPNLYAALRPMTGPHAATLRQRIRQETETVQRRRNTF